VNIIIIIYLLQTRGQYHRYNQTTQEHKEWLVIAHHRIGGVCTWPTHFYSAPSVASFTHRNTGIQYWERNEGILTSKLWGKQLTEKKKKVKVSQMGVHIGAQRHTNCFYQGFKCFAKQLSWDWQPINFQEFWSRIWRLTFCLTLCMLGLHTLSVYWNK